MSTSFCKFFNTPSSPTC